MEVAHSNRFSVMLSTKQQDKLTRKCEEDGISKAEVIRTLVQLYLDCKIEIKKNVSLDIEIK